MTFHDLTVPYCVERCGREATRTVPLGMVDATPVVEWVCESCHPTPEFG